MMDVYGPRFPPGGHLAIIIPGQERGKYFPEARFTSSFKRKAQRAWGSIAREHPQATCHWLPVTCQDKTTYFSFCQRWY